jgi:DNA-damage-inducible protein J
MRTPGHNETQKDVWAMVATKINVRTDSDIKSQAQKIFEELGLDMTTAINLFLSQTVRERDLPSVLSAKPQPARARGPLAHGRGSMKGRRWVAEDFDAPLPDFAEYME